MDGKAFWNTNPQRSAYASVNWDASDVQDNSAQNDELGRFLVLLATESALGVHIAALVGVQRPQD